MWTITVIYVLTIALAIGNGTPIAPGFSSSKFLKYEMNPFTPHGRIVGGVDVAISDVPYQVLLEVKGEGYCGGSIISEKWIITAGHCIIYPDDWVTVRAGSTNKNDGGSVYKVKKSIKHEKYEVNEHGIPTNDIALLKLSEPITFDESRQAIELFNATEKVKPGQLSRITGWGTLKQGGKTSDVLQTATVPIIDREECSKSYDAFGGLPDGQICAAHPTGDKDACQGDSGGPLAVAGKLAGVVSWGNGCAKKGYPGAYTEISKYRKWIERKTGF